MDDYKKLIPQFRSAPVLNALLDALASAFEPIYQAVAESFYLLNIDNCHGEYLDNLGALIGVVRPVLSNVTRWLSTDDHDRSLDTGIFFVTGAKTESVSALASDSYYRKLIKAQIIRNTLKGYSFDVFESILELLLDDAIENIKVDWTNYDDGAITIHIDDTFSHESRVFLQNYAFDKYGRMIFNFPYPPHIKQVTLIQDLNSGRIRK